MLRRRLMMQPKPDKWNYIMCKLNVTTTAARTNVISADFAGASQIDYITFNAPDNATRYAFDTGFQFTWVGERIMYIHFKGQPTTLENLFSGITAVTYIDMNELDTCKVVSMSRLVDSDDQYVQLLLGFEMGRFRLIYHGQIQAEKTHRYQEHVQLVSCYHDHQYVNV